MRHSNLSFASRSRKWVLSVSLITLCGSIALWSSTATAQQPISKSPLQNAQLKNAQLQSTQLQNKQSQSTRLQKEQSDLGIPANYLLGPGDSLQVDVFNATEYSGEFQVLPGGVLNLPMIGSISVGGMTITQASDVIEARLREFVRRPHVTVSVLAARPMQVAIAGEVNRPGAYTVALDGEAGIPTLTQVIDLAGGITQTADIRGIEVYRQLPAQGQGALASQDDRLQVDLMQLLREGRLEEDIALQNGDRILIPQAVALSPQEATELANASFSPDEMMVNVVGEVARPGSLQVPPNTPLNQVILAAGGFNNRAQRGNVTLVRLNVNGTVTQQEIAVDFASGVSQENNPPLRPNDTVIIGRNGLTQVTDVLGAVLSPLSGLFNLFRLLGD
jgi:polysaccharide biosynthesis/export protein